MRAYFRVAPNFGVSMPWWLAIFAYLIWLTAALAYWVFMVSVWLVVVVVQFVGLQWRKRHPA